MNKELTANTRPDTKLVSGLSQQTSRYGDDVSSTSTKPAAWRRALPLLWLLPFAVVFGLFQLAPMLWVLLNSFQAGGDWSLANFREIIDSPFYRQSFGNSIDLAVWSSLLGLLIALA
ncbi:MAG: hypothetical protein R3311_15095, partial [Oceanisphaera sp.]|nr:hypothetical protein [Oceanisphaera sp.]